MNYYEHHIKDYDTATSHLTWEEDLAYTRLIRWYYRKELPIPADVKEACRQVRATSKAQKDAVASVLNEFFELREDGWHNDTCDAAIARFKDGEPEREVKKANEENRLKRHREERSRLFKILTDAGHHAPWNIGMNELRELVTKVQKHKPSTADKPLPATAPATPATATQAPSTNHQTPDIEPIEAAAITTTPDAAASESIHARAIELTTMLRSRGASLQASDPRVIGWAQSGVTDAQALQALETAQERRAEAASPQPVNAGLLDLIIGDIRVAKPTAKKRTEAAIPPWWSSNELMIAKGKTLGLAPRPGEDWPQFRGRINAKLAEQAEQEASG